MSAPAGPPSIAYNLNSSYGAIFLCSFISAALWGTTCTQTFTYFLNYPKDHTWIKLMVIWLWLMDTTHQALVVKAMFGIFVTRFGDVAALSIIPPDFVSEIIFTVLVSSTAQLFFTYRLWLFSGKKWMFPLLVIPSVITQLVVQSIYMAGLLVNGSLPQLKKENPMGIAYNAMAAATDVVLAGCMIFLLLSEKSDFKSSNQLVGKLIMFTLNSGLWTALVATATVITILAIPLPGLIFPALYTLLCPLYCNTVLANLNSRKFLQQSTANASMPSHSNVPMETFSRSGERGPQRNVITIQVDTAKVTDTESLQEHDIKSATDQSF